MPNYDLGWEKTASTNFGIDFSFLRNRIFGSIEYYVAKTSDVIMNRSIPVITGYAQIRSNIGKTQNNGFELTLSTVNIKNKNFSWQTDWSFSTNKEKIVELTNGKVDEPGNNWFIGNNIAVMLKKSVPVNYLMNFRNRFINNGSDICNETGRPFDSKTGSVLWVSENFFYHGPWNPKRTDLWNAGEDGAICLNFSNNNLIVAGAPSYAKTEDGWNDYLAYKAFLPRFGGWTPVYAYPLATSQYCNEMFYPNWRAPDFCPQWWPDNDPYYPSYVRQGETISENELDGLRLSSYDSASDTAVGTFDFGSSRAETEH